MQTRAFAVGVCSGRVVSLTIVHSLEHIAVNHQHGVSLVSCAIRVLSESICISYNIHVELGRAACRFS